MSRYSVTIRGDGWREWCDRCYSMQDVIEYVIDQLSWCDNNACFLDSEITVYLKGTDDLIAYKSHNDSLQDFIVGLAQLSNDNKEEAKHSVLQWLSMLEKNLIIPNELRYVGEEF